MDFAWVVDALRRGFKVTRKAWAGDPPMYLYMTHGATSDMHVIRLCTGTMEDTVWNPRHEDILDETDWEEYVEPDHVCAKQEDADTIFKSIARLSAAINELLDKVQSLPQYTVDVEPGLTGHDIIVTVRQKAQEPDHV